jgi:hypothetical protein
MVPMRLKVFGEKSGCLFVGNEEETLGVVALGGFAEIVGTGNRLSAIKDDGFRVHQRFASVSSNRHACRSNLRRGRLCGVFLCAVDDDANGHTSAMRGDDRGGDIRLADRVGHNVDRNASGSDGVHDRRGTTAARRKERLYVGCTRLGFRGGEDRGGEDRGGDGVAWRSVHSLRLRFPLLDAASKSPVSWSRRLIKFASGSASSGWSRI